jgi:DNA repair exonuclease SbcCD ATPase subunit
MNSTNHSGIGKSAAARFGGFFIAGAAAMGLALATPAAAHTHVLNFGDDEDLLEKLIEMDAEDIQDMREEFADAREDIKDAIGDVEEAREEARQAPGGGAIVKIAFTAARAATSGAVKTALSEVRDAVDDAEHDLAAMNDISDEERVETQQAIDVLREELASLEVALEELLDALDA